MGQRRQIGLAVIGSDTIGPIRTMLARRYPGVGWLGLCDLDLGLGRRLAADAGADFFGEVVKLPVGPDELVV